MGRTEEHALGQALHPLWSPTTSDIASQVLYMNRFLKMNEVAILLRHYEELVRWDIWYT